MASVPYAVPPNGSEVTIGPFPFRPRGMTLVNGTSRRLTVTDDRGIAFPAAAATIVTVQPSDTVYLRLQLTGAALAGESATLYVSDVPLPITSSGLALANSVLRTLVNSSLVASEAGLNLIAGLGIKLTGVDDAANALVAVTIDQKALADTTLSSAAATIDVQNIPATYAHLRARGAMRTDRPASTDYVYCRFNNDSAGNYDEVFLFNDGTVLTPAAVQGNTYARVGFIPGAGIVSNLWGFFDSVWTNYALTTMEKAFMSRNASKWATGANQSQILDADGWWRNTAIVNRLTFGAVTGPNLVASSRLTIYGEAGA